MYLLLKNVSNDENIDANVVDCLILSLRTSVISNDFDNGTKYFFVHADRMFSGASLEDAYSITYDTYSK